MLAMLAWRNIWRNSRRSMIVLGSVVVGVVALIFMDSFMNGFVMQMLFNQIKLNVSHIQIHKEGFRDNKVVQNYIPDQKKVETVLDNFPEIQNYTKRVITFGLLSSARNSSGVYIYGVNPETEVKVSNIHKQIIEGDYLSGNGREILIGKKLAEKLEVGVGDKVVAMSNTPDGSIGSDVFRVTGIFQTVNSEFDKSNIIIPIERAQSMLEVGNKVYEFAMMINDYNKADEIAARIQNKLERNYEVQSYTKILPLLVLQMDMYKEFAYVLNFIIGLALIFGIINAMLMAVFERIREFGVLMSIGMKNYKLFLMIIFEAMFLGVIGTLVGFIIGLAIVYPLSHTGIDMSIFADSLESFGIGSIIYPRLIIGNLLNTLLTIPFITLIGAVYPAFKATRLQPVYAIRYV